MQYLELLPDHLDIFKYSGRFLPQYSKLTTEIMLFMKSRIDQETELYHEHVYKIYVNKADYYIYLGNNTNIICYVFDYGYGKIYIKFYKNPLRITIYKPYM